MQAKRGCFIETTQRRDRRINTFPIRPNGPHPSNPTRDLHQQYRRSEQRKGLQEVAKRSIEPARDPRERWPCLSRRGCPSITYLQARGMSTEDNLNEPESDAEGQHFQLEAHALRLRGLGLTPRHIEGMESAKLVHGSIGWLHSSNY